MGFTHLQVQSAYSLLNSSIRLEDYINLATSNQLKSLALVEDGTMHSAIKFYKACKKVGIKPIIGFNLVIDVDGMKDEWILIAKTNQGYERLLKLASIAALNNGSVAPKEPVVNRKTSIKELLK